MIVKILSFFVYYFSTISNKNQTFYSFIHIFCRFFIKLIRYCVTLVLILERGALLLIDNKFNLMERFSRIFGISFFCIEFASLSCTHQFQKKHFFTIDMKEFERNLATFDISKVTLFFSQELAVFNIPISENNEITHTILGVAKINHWFLNENNFITNESLNDIVQLIYFNFYGEETTIDEKKAKAITNFITESHSEDPIAEKVKANIEAGVFYQSYQKEKELLHAVKKGDVLLTKQAFEHFKKNRITTAKLADCEIRHKKNMLIAVVTIAARAAIEGGVSKEIAYTLSDKYICEIEKLPVTPNTTKTYDFSENILIDFAQKVARNKKQTASGYIYQCKQMIYLNIYNKLSVEEIAEKLELSQNYLSTFFKNEMGCTLKDYILKQKIEEAKHLILHSTHSSQEIYSMLHFSNQSHFIRVFKKYVKMTPKQYKEKYQLAKE